MKYFLQLTLTVFIGSMLVYALWSNIEFSTPDKGWIGSILFLPHGCRVIFYCFFGVRSLPALYLAEVTGPTLMWPDEYIAFSSIGSLFSLLSVVIAVETLKWSKVSTFSYSILKKINFANYKFLIYVTILSALLNAIFTNLVFSLLNKITIDVIVITRFFIGDVLGTLCFVAFLMILFNLLRKKRLLLVDDN
jgi:hypothetical protein